MHFHREKDCAKLINDQHQIKPALHETIFPSWIGRNNQSCAALKAPVQKKRLKSTLPPHDFHQQMVEKEVAKILKLSIKRIN